MSDKNDKNATSAADHQADEASCLLPDGRVDNDAWRALSRRRFLAAMGVSGSLAAQGAVLGAALSGFSRSARADNAAPATPGDDHYFIFVEMAGGFNWPMSIDARDPALVMAGPTANFLPMDVRTPWTQDQFQAMQAKSQFTYQNGGGCLMPYDSTRFPTWDAAVRKGKTTLGLPYALGFCGDALLPLVDQFAVVRGVKMAGNFHGKGNSSDDMWSGTDKGDQPHVASVLAALLEKKYGVKPLDNIVLENAFFPENESVGAKTCVRTDGKTLGMLLSSFAAANQISGMTAADRFQRFTNVANSVLSYAKPRLGTTQSGIFQSYIDKFPSSLAVQGKLLGLGSQLSQNDISLDLKGQFDLAFTLMEAGLTRVMTLCLGAPNTTNRADPNGLFDAHTGLYTADTPPTNSTENNWQQITRATEAMAYFAARLQNLDPSHPLKGKITVCMTSEFTRQGNTNGNERNYPDNNNLVHFGGGHNFQNNNYVLFGKNVRPGAWIGRAGITSLVRYNVDFSKLASTPIAQLMDEAAGVFQKPADDSAVTNVSSEPPPAPGQLRGFASRDMVMTALALAGFSDQYNKFYARTECKDAQVVTPVIATT